MKYLSNKPMFFDMGKPPVDPFDALRAEPAPSNYYTSAPASLPGAPPPCAHREFVREDNPQNATVVIRCYDCDKTWTFSFADIVSSSPDSLIAKLT